MGCKPFATNSWHSRVINSCSSEQKKFVLSEASVRKRFKEQLSFTSMSKEQLSKVGGTDLGACARAFWSTPTSSLAVSMVRIVLVTVSAPVL